MIYFIKSKRKHGRSANAEDYRWHRGYPDEPVYGKINEPHMNTKVEAFKEFAEWEELVNDIKLPMIDFNIHLVESDHPVDSEEYEQDIRIKIGDLIYE